MALTLAEANRIVQAAITKAQEMNIKVSAAVCDAGRREALRARRRHSGLAAYSAADAQLAARLRGVDKILNGTKPADLPVAQPTKALALSIPQPVLLSRSSGST